MRFTIIMLLCFAAVRLAAAPSPWDSWRSGYMTFEQAEELRERGNYTEALANFKKSRKHYVNVRTARPDWNQRVIAERIADCDKKITEINNLLGRKSLPAETVKSNKKSVASPAPGRGEAQEINRMRKELSALQAELETLRKSGSRQQNFEREIADLMHDRRVLKEKYDLLEARYKKLEAEAGKPDAQIRELQTRLVEERIMLERTVKRADDAGKRLAAAESELKNSRMAKNAAEKLMRQAENEVLRLRGALEEAKKKSTTSGSREEELNREIARLRKELKTLLAEGKGGVSYNGASPAMGAALAERENKIASLKKDIEALGKALQQTENRMQKEMDAGNRAAKELTAAKAQQKELLAQNEQLQSRNEALEKDFKLLSERNSALQRRLNSRDDEAFRNASAAQETCKKLEKDLLALQQQLVEVRSADDSKNNKLAELERKVKVLGSELLAARAKAIEQEKKAAAAEGELTALRPVKEQFAELQRNFAALSKENSENRALAAAAKPREAELSRVKLRLLETERIRQDLVKEQRLNGELAQEMSRLRREIQSFRTRVSELDAARRKVIDLEAAVRELNHLKTLRPKIDELTKREQEAAALKIKNGELENKLADTGAKLNAAVKRIGELEKNNASTAGLRDKADALSKHNKELKAIIAEQHSELERLAKNGTGSGGSGLSADSKKLASQIAALNDALSSSRSKNESLQKRYDALEARFNADGELLSRREEELKRLRKLNAELADYRKNSADDLVKQTLQQQLTNHAREVQELNRLNAELAAERDRIAAELEARKNGVEPDTETVKPSESPEELTAAGAVAEKNGNIELALWNYRQALAADKDYSGAHLRLGLLLFFRKNHKEALPHLSAARAADPQNLELALYTARCQVELKRFGNARIVTEPLLKKYADDYRVQLLSGIIDAASGKISNAEERMMTAARLAPDKPEIYIELAQLLSTQVNDRSSEAVTAYEKARSLGCQPVPGLEKKLRHLLDHRREMIRFLSGAASEAELSGDWGSAVWYYKKLVAMERKDFVPHLALAQLRGGNAASARETLEFNKPSRCGMAVMTLIELESGSEVNALRAARQSAGITVPENWVAFKMELEKLSAKKHPSAAERILLVNCRRK